MSRGRVRVCAAIVCAALVMMFSASPGMAEFPDTPQASLDDIVTSLGIASSPVDYVVIVDTSGSMQGSGLYPKVTSALGAFLRALKPTDHLSLLTFDTTATLRYTGAVGGDPRSALNQLPPIAAGQNTDIGAGIEAGIAELERPNASTVGAIVLMTDGKIQAPPGSAFSAPSAPTWNALQERARKITARHRVASYALALDTTTDAGLLKNLFSDTLVVALPSDQIEGYLGRVRSDSVRQKVMQTLLPDLGNRASVSVTGKIDNLDQEKGIADVTLTLSSPYSKIPVTVDNLSVGVTGDLGANVSRPPSSITIRPGEPESLRLRLTFPAGDASGLVRRFFTHHGEIVLTGSARSPWRQVITSDLGLDFAPRLENPPVDIPVPGVIWLSFEDSLRTFVIALVVLLLALSIRRYRTPRTVGKLELWHEGRFASDVILGGKTMNLGKSSSGGPVPLSGSVRGLRGRDDNGETAGVRVRAKSNRVRAHGKLFDEDSLQVGEITIIYRCS